MNKLVEEAKRAVADHPKENKAAFLESKKHPVLDHAHVVRLFPTVTAANDALRERLAELEAEGWKKFYGGTTKGIVGLVDPVKMTYYWLAVDKPRKR